MNCKIASLYICVKDMKRAVRFYESFFDMPVTEYDEIYSVFDINGFRFGFIYQTPDPRSFSSDPNNMPLQRLCRSCHLR